MYRNKHISTFLILCMLGISLSLSAQSWKNYPYTPEGSLISFPVDEGWHPDEAIEWWYIAGHLEGAGSGTPYSFMLSYFYYPATVGPYEFEGFRILNISNDQTGVFHTETMVLNYVDLDTSQMHIDARLLNSVSEHWFHKEETNGTLIPFEYELSATAGENALMLSSVSQKPPLIPGGDGLFDQGANSYTYYYSLTENQVEGSLTFEGVSEEVSGTAWIDRQYGTFNPQTGEEYEWFYLQLSNGMDLNIWNLFTPDNQLPDDPAYKHISVYVNEGSQYTSYAFNLERLSWAKMPETENCYAREWRLTSETDLLDLTFSTLHNNQEVELPFNFFEGAITAAGSVNGIPVSGKGFAELLKNYEAPQLQITGPGTEWNALFPIQWMVLDPDMGRPLLFDLAWSTSGTGPWNTLATGISDTSYIWSDHPLVNGDSCWFSIEGYTADLTLVASAQTSLPARYNDQYTSLRQNSGSEVRQAPVRIYPNPAADRLWIETSREGDCSYRILDLTGRLLESGSATGGWIDIRGLQKGVYLVWLNQSGQVCSWPFIKE